MRTNTIMPYQSILQVLKETGCPFCRFMKNFQSALLQNSKESTIHHLCNFHTWGLAATQRGTSGAEIFLALLHQQGEEPPVGICDICNLLREEEDLRIREFLSCLSHKLVAEWLRSEVVLCTIHGSKLKHGASPVLVSSIGAIMERYRRNLIKDLERLRNEYQPDDSRWGLLGHAAEFLVSQRGLHV